MSSYADIGFCVKEALAQSMPQPVQDWLEFEAETYFQDDVILYVVRAARWDISQFPQQSALREWLSSLPYNDFLLLIVWHDYPTSQVDDMGGLVVNPFNLKRVVRAELEFTE